MVTARRLIDEVFKYFFLKIRLAGRLVSEDF